MCTEIFYYQNKKSMDTNVPGNDANLLNSLYDLVPYYGCECQYEIFIADDWYEGRGTVTTNLLFDMEHGNVRNIRILDHTDTIKLYGLSIQNQIGQLGSAINTCILNVLSRHHELDTMFEQVLCSTRETCSEILSGEVIAQDKEIRRSINESLLHISTRSTIAFGRQEEILYRELNKLQGMVECVREFLNVQEYLSCMIKTVLTE